MDLAERGTCLSNGLWVRELRKRSERGHQTAILCTDYRSEAAPLAMAMFARWSQENFFKYAREHFSLDRLVDYRTEAISDPLRVVNPDYRHLDGQVRSATGKLTRRLAKFAAMTLDEPIERKNVEPFVRRKATLQEEIERLARETVERGEAFSDEELERRQWDLRGLSTWAMSRFKVSLSQNQLQRMEPNEVELQLGEAAAEQIDHLDLATGDEGLGAGERNG